MSLSPMKPMRTVLVQLAEELAEPVAMSLSPMKPRQAEQLCKNTQ
jgi:hypothetical protein